VPRGTIKSKNETISSHEIFIYNINDKYHSLIATSKKLKNVWTCNTGSSDDLDV